MRHQWFVAEKPIFLHRKCWNSGKKYMQLVADDCFGIPINNRCRYNTIQLNEPNTMQSENKMHDKIISNVNICTFNHNLFYRNWNNDDNSFLLAQTHTHTNRRIQQTKSHAAIGISEAHHLPQSTYFTGIFLQFANIQWNSIVVH